MFLSGFLGVFGFGVDFGDSYVRFGDEVVGEFFPGWGEALAVCDLGVSYVVCRLRVL